MSLDLLGARVGFVRAEFEPVERALASQRLALVLLLMTLLAEHILTPAHGGEQRIAPQLVVIVDVLIPQRDAQDALAQHDRQCMLDVALLARIGEALSELLTQALGAVRLAQQQAATIAGEMAAGEIDLDTSASQPLKIETLLITVCRRLSRVHLGAPVCFCLRNQRLPRLRTGSSAP
jgi:hypothetical protein